MNWRRYFSMLQTICAKVGRIVLKLISKEWLMRTKRRLTVWTRRYPVEFFGVIALGVLGLWLLNPLLMHWWADGFANAGPVGDSFGALTSLFTGAAFVGLIATLMQQQREIRMQRQDLKLQREEMKAARSELEGQKEQMELQNQSIRQQMFEQTFLGLLKAHTEYVESMSIRVRMH